MPITVTERIDSRPSSTGDNGSITLNYILDGTDDNVEALSVLSACSAATYAGLNRQSIEIEPDVVDTSDGSGRWNAAIKYGPKPQPQNEPTIQFDTGGGTQHVTQAVKHVNHVGCMVDGVWGGPAPDFKGAVGVTSDNVEGVDITVPVYAWTETHYLPDADVQAHKSAYYNLTGKTNSASWRGFAEGEVLLMGVSGSKKGEDDWEITFKFAASPSVADVCGDWPADVKPPVAVPKKGWEYMWVRYQDGVDNAGKALIKQPRGVYIEQVYRSGDMTTLGIGN